jgi:hypothetical protein
MRSAIPEVGQEDQSDPFPFGWLLRKLQQPQFLDPDQLLEVVNDIFTSLSVDMIEEAFRNRIHRPEAVIP